MKEQECNDNHKGMQANFKRFSVKLFDLDQRSELIKLFFAVAFFCWFYGSSRTTISLIEPLVFSDAMR